MRTLLVDIETAPLGWHEPAGEDSLFARAFRAARDAAENAEPPSNYKKKESIDKWRMEQIKAVPDDALKRYGQHSTKGDTCQIVTIVVQDPMSGEPVSFHDPEDEAAVLSGFRAYLLEVHDDLEKRERMRLVAWHGHSFDFPVLARRYAYHGDYRLAANLWNNLDYVTRQEMGGLSRGLFELVDAARIYPRARGDKTRLRDMDTDLMQELDPLKGDGGQVLPALLDDRAGDVLQHCIVDVQHRLMTVWCDVVYPMLQARGAE